MNSSRMISRSDLGRREEHADAGGHSRRFGREAGGSESIRHGDLVHSPLRWSVAGIPPDLGAYNAVCMIGRSANDNFGSPAAYLANALGVFGDVRRCSIYLKPFHPYPRKSVLEHELTITTNGGIKTESLDDFPSITNRNDISLLSFAERKPRLIDFGAGLYIVAKNLDMNSDRCDIFSIRRRTYDESFVVVPLYYREREHPFGIMELEGDLRCRGSRMGSIPKAFFSLKTTVLLSAQVGLMLMQRLDDITHFLKKRDFRIDLKDLVQKVLSGNITDDVHRAILLLIDLDHFKPVNDTHGYLAGDMLISATAQAMLSSIDRRNDADKIYRWGGEEFVVLPRLMSMDEAKALAERIRTKVKETKVRVNDQDIKVTCSIGLLDVGAMISSSGSMRGAGLPDDIFDRCTTLLRASKEGGRNRVTVL